MTKAYFGNAIQKWRRNWWRFDCDYRFLGNWSIPNLGAKVRLFWLFYTITITATFIFLFFIVEEIEREIRRYFENRLENLLIDKSYFVGFRSGDNLISMINICDDPMVCRSIGSISEKATLLELFGRISGISKRKELYFHQVSVFTFCRSACLL